MLHSKDVRGSSETQRGKEADHRIRFIMERTVGDAHSAVVPVTSASEDSGGTRKAARHCEVWSSTARAGDSGNSLRGIPGDIQRQTRTTAGDGERAGHSGGGQDGDEAQF